MGPRGSITIPGDDEVIEEVLVVQLSDVVPDPIQFEREVCLIVAETFHIFEFLICTQS